MYNKQSENHVEEEKSISSEQIFAAGCADKTAVNMSAIFYPERSFVLSCEFWESIADV
jgi:hypothetical protein